MALEVIILAAGKGTRMKSALPKVLHKLGGETLVERVVHTAQHLRAEQIHLVYGHGAELLKKVFSDGRVNLVEQAEQKGTGHAVAQVLPFINKKNQVLVLYGDVPLLSVDTLNKLISKAEQSFALLTVHLDNPQGYGRIIRDADGHIMAIVEQKDASDIQRQIKEVNTGVMCVKGECLARWLPLLSADNSQGEYYLTDIVAMAKDEEIPIIAEHPTHHFEVEGVNDRQQLARLERIYQHHQAQQWMLAGVTLMDPLRFDVRGKLSVGMDVCIDINVVLEGHVILGQGVSIGPNCVIKNATIGDNVHIYTNSLIEDCVIEEGCTVGPFARLRPKTHLKAKAKVGNFVEVKKSTIGEGSKVNHLSYIGDTTVGSEANIGAGTITCNYDGVNKFQTEIADGAFIGSNSALIAPVKIGKNATVGAGSAINKDVPDDTLAIARGKQITISNWKRPVKKP